MKLSPTAVYLWFTFVEEIHDKLLLAEYKGLLSEDELKKFSRFRFATHKRRYLVGRALIRTILSRCTGLAPEQLVFSREEHGRPYILQSGKSPPPQFNLSYTDGLVGVALTVESRVGFDVENTSKEIDCLAIAESYFSPDEHKELKLLSEPLLKKRFFELWTLKEAYVKAQGSGLLLPLDQLDFHLREKNNEPSKETSIVPDDGRHWQFETFKPGEKHRAAFCVCKNFQMPYKVISKKQFRWKQKRTQLCFKNTNEKF